MNRYAHKKTKAERCDVLFIQTIDTRQLSAWIKDLRYDMIFFSLNAKYGSIDKMDGILVPNESFE